MIRRHPCLDWGRDKETPLSGAGLAIRRPRYRETETDKETPVPSRPSPIRRSTDRETDKEVPHPVSQMRDRGKFLPLFP